MTSNLDITGAVASVKSLLNSQLKDILRHEHLPVSGVKCTLQARVIELVNSLTDLQNLAKKGQIQSLERVKSSINAVQSGSSVSVSSSRDLSNYYNQSYHPSLSYNISNSTTQSRPRMTTSRPPIGTHSFKDSPFYTILEALSPVANLKIREKTRDVAEMRVIFNQSIAMDLASDPTKRIMVFCLADNPVAAYTKNDIAFPHQIELKVNLDEVKANLRGLKNKPGTTRPADVTQFIRKKPNYVNKIEITYALTTQEFFALPCLVQRHSVEELVQTLRLRQPIFSDQIIREMKSRADDPEIIATSTVMSLKCPLSTLRMKTPCRSTICSHNQCFDAESFLQLQEQAPTWTCPVCNKTTTFESLQVDEYVESIINSTSCSTQQVTIEPNGEWLIPGDSNETHTSQQQNDDDNSDSFHPDIVEISETNPVHVKRERLPSHSLHAESSTPRALCARTSSKRSASEVVDLTLSDNDEPNVPARRQQGRIVRARYDDPSASNDYGLYTNTC